MLGARARYLIIEKLYYCVLCVKDFKNQALDLGKGVCKKYCDINFSCKKYCILVCFLVI